jgi:hypothetical protein
MHDSANNKLPQAFKDYATPVSDIHSYNIPGILHLPSSTNYGKFSVKLKGIAIWNKLSPEEIFLICMKFKKFVKYHCFFTYT